MLGLSNTQISEVLERTSSTVKKRKHNIKTAIFGVQDTNIHFEIILRRLCSWNLQIIIIAITLG